MDHNIKILILYICILVLQSSSASAKDGSRTSKRKSKSQSDKDSGKDTNTKRQPNIIFILVDDLGFNDVGYHGEGGSALTTPTIDRLAMEGVRLENYYVQPSCTPTRSQLMTGRYQIHTGMQHDNLAPSSPHCLPLKERTLAQALQSAGYSTHAVGKWHLGYSFKECLPTRRGFHSYLGMVLGYSNHFDYTRQSSTALYFNETPMKHVKRYSTLLYTERAEEIIRFHEGKSKPPFFIFLSYQSQHSPLQVPSEYIQQYSNRIHNSKRQKYAAMLSAVDEGINNITQTLVSAGLWQNTLLIFSTDNGGRPKSGGINWPLRGGKSTLWEGGVRGVAFVTGPVLPTKVRGSVNKGLCHVSDWLPTLVRGVAKHSTKDHLPLDGFNIWRMISLGKPSPRKELLHNIDPLEGPTFWTLADEKMWGRLSDLPFNVTMRAAIRHGDWKLVTGHVGSSKWSPPPESLEDISQVVQKDRRLSSIRLFNIKQDPTENHDVASRYHDIVMRLLRRLAEYQSTAVKPLDHSVTIKHPKWNATMKSAVRYWFELPNALVITVGAWVPWMNTTLDYDWGL
ncbi:arylsulfatase B-like [Asterias amurensis]|uniref:arylsulfatase B-like n=1 Tax=Asterias amurensis TaxID=7602 RepID=UPI003AB11A6C